MNSQDNHYCSGCGQSIQTHDPEALGYAPKLESELCQRCFRLKHYKDTAAFKKDQVDSWVEAGGASDKLDKEHKEQ